MTRVVPLSDDSDCNEGSKKKRHSVYKKFREIRESDVLKESYMKTREINGGKMDILSKYNAHKTVQFRTSIKHNAFNESIPSAPRASFSHSSEFPNLSSLKSTPLKHSPAESIVNPDRIKSLAFYHPSHLHSQSQILQSKSMNSSQFSSKYSPTIMSAKASINSGPSPKYTRRVNHFVTIEPHQTSQDNAQPVMPKAMSNESSYDDYSEEPDGRIMKSEFYSYWKTVPKVLKCLQQNCCRILGAFFYTLESSCGGDGSTDYHDYDNCYDSICEDHGGFNPQNLMCRSHRNNKMHLETVCLECGVVLSDVSKGGSKIVHKRAPYFDFSGVPSTTIYQVPNFPSTTSPPSLTPPCRPKDSYADIDEKKIKKNFVPLPEFDDNLTQKSSIVKS